MVYTADKSLGVSCISRPEIYNEPFIGITCIFRNAAESARTLKIQSVRVMGNQNDFLVLDANEIYQLALVYRDRQLHNNNLAFLGGLVALTSQPNNSIEAIFPLAAVALSNTLQETESYQYSANHMLSPNEESFRQGTITKNMLVSRPNSDTIPMHISICMTEPTNECLTLRPEISHDIYRLRLYEQTH